MLSPWNVGLLFLFVVALIWSSASLITQFIYQDLGFNSPFVLTYAASSYFSLYLPIWLISTWYGERRYEPVDLEYHSSNPIHHHSSETSLPDDDNNHIQEYESNEDIITTLESNTSIQKTQSYEHEQIHHRHPHHPYSHSHSQHEYHNNHHQQRHHQQHQQQQQQQQQCHNNENERNSQYDIDINKNYTMTSVEGSFIHQIHMNHSSHSTDNHNNNHDYNIMNHELLLSSDKSPSTLKTSTNNTHTQHYDHIKLESLYITPLNSNSNNTSHTIPSITSTYLHIIRARLKSFFIPFHKHTTTHQDIIYTCLYLAPLWFIANISYNYSLLLTSISSSTIISNTSGIYALFFSWLLQVEDFTWGKFIGVCMTILGVILVSYHDETATTTHSVFGDVFAVLGALLYGLFTTIIKIKLTEEEVVSMQLVLGYMGLLTFILFLPPLCFMIAYNIDNVKSFNWTTFGFTTINALFDDVIADYLFTRAILLTTPTVANVGTSMTIPLALLTDTVLYYTRTSHSAEEENTRDYPLDIYTISGSLFVILGFVLVNISIETIWQKIYYVGSLCKR